MSGLDLKIGVTRPRCPYCHGDVLVEEPKAACDACMAWHHAECFEGTGTCGACGEQGAALRRVAPTSESPPETEPRAPTLEERMAARQPEPDLATRIQKRFDDPGREQLAKSSDAAALAVSVLATLALGAAAFGIGGAGLFLLVPALLGAAIVKAQLKDPVRNRRARWARMRRARERRRERRERRSAKDEL